ncbi:hypothetical protein, partial [uncultured Carboxylicivirga sp.]
PPSQFTACSEYFAVHYFSAHDEAIGYLANQNNQNLSEPNLLFVFIFSFLKPNQRFGGVRLPKVTSNPHKRQLLYTSVLCPVIYHFFDVTNSCLVVSLFINSLIRNVKMPLITAPTMSFQSNVP